MGDNAGVLGSGAQPPAPPHGIPLQLPRARDECGRRAPDRLLPASGPARPPLASDLCAVWHFTWLLISTFTLVFWVEKWPKFIPHSLMSLLIFSVAYVGGTMGRSRRVERSDFVFTFLFCWFFKLPLYVYRRVVSSSAQKWTRHTLG